MNFSPIVENFDAERSLNLTATLFKTFLLDCIDDVNTLCRTVSEEKKDDSQLFLLIKIIRVHRSESVYCHTMHSLPFNHHEFESYLSILKIHLKNEFFCLKYFNPNWRLYYDVKFFYKDKIVSLEEQAGFLIYKNGFETFSEIIEDRIELFSVLWDNV